MAKDDKKKSKKSKKTNASKKTNKKSVKLSRSEKQALKTERKKATKRDIKNMGFVGALKISRLSRKSQSNASSPIFIRSASSTIGSLGAA